MKKNYLGLIIGILLFITWYHYFMPTGIWEEMRELKAVWLIFAGVSYFLAFSLRAIRWLLILKPLKIKNTGKIFPIYWAGTWVNYLFPLKVVGEIVKSYQLKKFESLPMSTTLPTVFVEKFYAFSVMIISLVFLPLFSFKLHRVVAIALALVGIIYLIMLIFIFGVINRKEQLNKIIYFFLFFLPHKAKVRTVNLAESFIEGLTLVKQEGVAVIGLIAASFMVLIFDSLNLYCLFTAVNLPIPFLATYFGSCMLNLFYVLPAPPASVGTNEMYGTLIFVFGFGFSATRAPLAILAGHGINALILASMGTVSLVLLGESINELRSAPLEVEK